MIHRLLRLIKVMMTAVILILMLAAYACMLTPPPTGIFWAATATAQAVQTIRGNVVAREVTEIPTISLIVTAAATLPLSPINTPSPTVTLPPTITVMPVATPLAATPTPPSSTPPPTATSVPTLQPVGVFASGGLGLDRTEFAKLHSEIGQDITGGTIYAGGLIVTFQAEKVWRIEQQWGAEDLIVPQNVNKQSITLIPLDSIFVETYTPAGRPEATVNLYMSESLKSRFDNWIGGSPGNFTVQYNTYDGYVSSMIIATGNNP